MAFIKKKMTGNSSENMQKELPLVLLWVYTGIVTMEISMEL